MNIGFPFNLVPGNIHGNGRKTSPLILVGSFLLLTNISFYV